MKFQTFIITAIVLSMLVSCKNDKPEVIQDLDCQPVKKLSPRKENLNVSIFLDLSDRISPVRSSNTAMEYWKRDLGYIETIVGAFQNHVRNKKVSMINDNIKLRIHPLPDNIPEINEMMKSLDMHFDRENATLDNICSIYPSYMEHTEQLYKTMLEQKEPAAQKGIDDYPGSDIFGFFKSNVKDFCIKKGQRNILFILTDGYEYYKGNSLDKDANNKSNYILSSSLKQWGFNASNYQTKLDKQDYGFKLPTTGLEDLEIYLIGIAPKQSWEQDVLLHYWTNWFEEMGVKNFQDGNGIKFIKEADLPANLDNSIQEFIYQ